jgi:hypothetical protein
MNNPSLEHGWIQSKITRTITNTTCISVNPGLVTGRSLRLSQPEERLFNGWMDQTKSMQSCGLLGIQLRGRVSLQPT